MTNKNFVDEFKQKLKIVIFYISIILLYPIIIPVYLLIVLYRHLICLIVRRDPQIKSILSGHDALITLPPIYDNPVCTLMTMYPLAASADIDHIKKQVKSGLINATFSDGSLKFPELKQKVICKWGYAFWRQVDSFNLDNHVKYLCPDDIFEPVYRSQFRQVIPTLGDRNFNPECSPWEIVVVPNFVDPCDTSVKSLIILRFHHCMCDGFAMVSMINHMSTRIPKPTVSPKCVATSSTWMSSRWTGLSVLVKAPYVVLEQLAYSNTNALVAATHRLSRKEKMMYIESKTISTSELKPIQNFCNVRLASVVCGIFVETILSAMRRKYGPLPDEIIVVIPTPIPGHPGTLTNHFTTYNMRVQISYDDPLQTLKNIEESYTRFQKSGHNPVIASCVQWLGKLPLTDEPLRNKPLLDSTGVLSNFRFAEKPIDLFGYEVTEVNSYGRVPFQPYVVVCVGYAGQLKFSGGILAELFDDQDADIITAKFYSQVATYLKLIGTDKKVK